MNGKIGEYIDKHFGQFIAMTLVVLVVGIFGGILAVDAVNKQTRRWDSWMWAHQMEFVPGLKWNSNQCVGESKDQYANRFCEEPSTLYKKYWIWKHY
jgi:hypothetical protein